MSNIKLRFHLAAGPHFKHWQLKVDEAVSFHNPDNTSFSMRDVTLVNHKSAARKIHEGANKTVCAWLRPKHVEVSSMNLDDLNQAFDSMLDMRKEGTLVQVMYNPREFPHWVDNSGNNLDGTTLRKAITIGKLIYAII